VIFNLIKIIYLVLFLILFSLNINLLKADSKMKMGLDVYNNKAMCGSCHILSTTGSTGKIGPNLDDLKPQIPQIILAVTNGIGVMPAFEGMLTSEEIEAVAYFVSTSSNK
jgi:mono/diheme cytochrome c family protein